MIARRPDSFIRLQDRAPNRVRRRQRGNMRTDKVKKQNTLVAALVVAISATGAVWAQSSLDVNPDSVLYQQRQQLESLQYDVDRLNDQIESDRVTREWDKFEAEQAAKRAASQILRSRVRARAREIHRNQP